MGPKDDPKNAHCAFAILRRRIFTGLTILSLLLCVGTVALWGRSYWRYEVFQWVTHSPEKAWRFGAYAEDGEVLFFSTYADLGFFPIDAWHYTGSSSGPSIAGREIVRYFGFGYSNFNAPNYSTRGIGVPDWFLALLFAILPAMRLGSILRTRRRDRAGLCPHCGYDLRATPTRCPECGHTAPPATPS